MREQRGRGVRLVGVEAFEYLGDRLMHASTLLRELRVVRHLLGQRVLERVLRFRVSGFLVDELRVREATQHDLESGALGRTSRAGDASV